MKKCIIILNITPFLLWILLFACQLNNVFPPVDSAMIQLGLLLCIPVVFAIINVICAKNEKHFLCFNGIFTISHILGFYLSGALYHSFISNNPENELVINTFSFISILYIAIITLVCFLVKIIFKKSNRVKGN